MTVDCGPSAVDPWSRVWLGSRALFDAYRRELPQRGERIAPDLYLYDRVPEGISWAVWALVRGDGLIVGYPPFEYRDLPATFNRVAFAFACDVFFEDLVNGRGQGIGWTRYFDGPSDMQWLRANYAARVGPDGELQVAWGVRGDWCGAGLIDWWGIPSHPFYDNAPLPERFADRAFRFDIGCGRSRFALRIVDARAYVAYCHEDGIPVVGFDVHRSLETPPVWTWDGDTGKCLEVLADVHGDFVVIWVETR